MKVIADLYDTGIARRALLEAVIVGIFCGAVGVHVVLRKLPFFAVGVAHSSFPGIVAAVVMGASPLVGATVSSVALIMLVWLAGLDRRLDTSTVVGVVVSGSFAIGALVQSTQQGFSRNLAAILVGNVLATTWNDVALTCGIAVLCLGAARAIHKELVLGAFDPIGAQALGYSRGIELMALLIVGGAVIATVPAVGVVLSVALLTIPALSARLVTSRVGPAMIVAAAYGAVAAALGVTISAQWRVAAGASICLSAGGLFFLTWAVSALAASRQKMVVLADAGSPA